MHDYKTLLRRAGAVLFWLAVWQAAAMAIGQEVFLVSPVQALRCLLRLLPHADFWHRVGQPSRVAKEAVQHKTAEYCVFDHRASSFVYCTVFSRCSTRCSAQSPASRT